MTLTLATACMRYLIERAAFKPFPRLHETKQGVGRTCNDKQCLIRLHGGGCARPASALHVHVRASVDAHEVRRVKTSIQPVVTVVQEMLALDHEQGGESPLHIAKVQLMSTL